MSILSHIAVDWRRYQIRNCSFPETIPCGWAGPHLWVPTEYFVMSWDWDLGHVAIGFEPGFFIDGASIPVIAGGIVDPIAALPGSWPHDKGYTTCAGTRPYQVWTGTAEWEERQLRDANTGLPIKWDGIYEPSEERRRARADAVLMAFWLASGMPRDMAERGYAAVRLAGSRAWESVETPDPVRPDIAARARIQASAPAGLLAAAA